MSKYSKPHHDADPTAIKKIKNQKTIICPRGLSITWGNDNRYWRLPRKNNHLMPNAAAELLQVSWLEVTCSTDNVEAGKNYKVGFNVSMKPDAFGWKDSQIYIMAKIGKMGKFIYKKVSLEAKGSDKEFNVPEDDLKITVKAPPDAAGDHRLYFGMYEVWSENWKGGLRIHHAFVEKVGN